MADRGDHFEGDIAGNPAEFVPNQAKEMIASGNRWYNVSMASALVVIVGILFGCVPTPVLLVGMAVAVISLWQAKTQTKDGEDLSRRCGGTPS